MIQGGFYLKARCIQEAAIRHAPPHVREIWDWLLLKAMYRDGKELDKGQVLTSYQEIRDGLSWKVGYRTERYSKWDCEKAMKWLTKEQMVTTAKTTRGLIITICKYCYYQDFKNYESHTEGHNEATMKPQPTATIEKEVKEVKHVKRKPPQQTDDSFWKDVRGLYTWVNIDQEIAKMKGYQLTPKGRKWKMTQKSVINWLNRIDRPIDVRPKEVRLEDIDDGSFKRY